MTAKMDLLVFLRKWYAESLHEKNPEVDKGDAIIMAALLPSEEIVEAFHRTLIKESLQEMEYDNVKQQQISATLLSLLKDNRSM